MGNLDLTQLSGSQDEKYLTINTTNGEIEDALTEVHEILFEAGDGNALSVASEDFRRHSIFVITDDVDAPTPENVLTFPEIKRGVFTVVNKGDNILRVQTASQTGWPRPECTANNSMTCFCDGTSVIRCNSERIVAVYIEQPVNNKNEYRFHAPYTLWIQENDEGGADAVHTATWEGGCGTLPTGDVVFDVQVNGISIGDLTFTAAGAMKADLALTGFAKNIKVEIISPADIKGIGKVAVTMVFTT